MNHKYWKFFCIALFSFVVLNQASPAAAMLGVTHDGELVSIDIRTGAATLIGPLPEPMTEAVYDSANDRLYAQGSNGSFTLYEIEPATGSQISVVSTTGAYTGLEFVGGVLYATMITGGGGDSDLVTVDPATGTASIIGPTGYQGITGLAYDTSTSTMYGSVGGGSADSGALVTINLASGAASIIGPTGPNKVGSIEFGSDGNLYGGVTSTSGLWPGALITIDYSGGAAANPVNIDTGFSITGLANVPIAGQASEDIPTLAEWALIALVILMGFTGIVAVRRTA
jgi:hypothetical protein